MIKYNCVSEITKMGAAPKPVQQNNMNKRRKRQPPGMKKSPHKLRPPSLFANQTRPLFPPPQQMGPMNMGPGNRGMRRNGPPFPPNFGPMRPMGPPPPPMGPLRGPMPPLMMRGPPNRCPMPMMRPPMMRGPPMPGPPMLGPPMGPPRGGPFGCPPHPLIGRPLNGPMNGRNMKKFPINKKKKNGKFAGITNEENLNKPWVTDELKGEIEKKNELLKTAKELNKHENWESYRSQRDKCTKLFFAAKAEYAEKHPEEVRIPQLCPNQNTPPQRLRHMTATIDFTKDVEL